MAKLIQKGNAKLHNMYMFNITASKQVCKRICPGCYAHKEQVRFPTTVLGAREQRLAEAFKPTFAQNIITELAALRTKPKYFRVHASGEFFSQDYINAWVTIINANPMITFYAYTKRLKHFDFSELANLSNFVLINSLQFGGLNYGPIELAPSTAFICPSYTGATCGLFCTYCMDKQAQTNGVYFIQH